MSSQFADVTDSQLANMDLPDTQPRLGKGLELDANIDTNGVHAVDVLEGFLDAVAPVPKEV